MDRAENNNATEGIIKACPELVARMGALQVCEQKQSEEEDEEEESGDATDEFE